MKHSCSAAVTTHSSGLICGRRLPFSLALAVGIFSVACSNDPHPAGLASTNTLIETFSERSPRYLDPTASYSNNESKWTYQIYDTLYGYHYLKRPYQLTPKAAAAMPKVSYFDKTGQALGSDATADEVAVTVYDIAIKPGMKFAPHPAFATDEAGKHRYHALKTGDVGLRRRPQDFEHQGSREVLAEDFVYAIKRHATPRVEAPIFGVFSEYVLGLKELGKAVKDKDTELRKGLKDSDLDRPFLDFRSFQIEGVSAPEKHLLRFRIKGKYPQWSYWLAMTFASPIPWEAEAFYAQPGMAANGLNLSKWPVGSGAYMLTEYEQDRRHVMVKNPNYRDDFYPCDGMPEDKAAGLLADCGKKMPFIDAIVSNLEKEKLPETEKFRQGYIDTPEMERNDNGNAYLVEMQDSETMPKNIKNAVSNSLSRSIPPTGTWVSTGSTRWSARATHPSST